MGRLLKVNMLPWAPAGASASIAIVASFIALFNELKMPDLGIQVIFAVVIGLILWLLRFILGPIRRYSGNWFIQFAAMASYNFPISVAFYIANDVWSSNGNHYHVMGCLVLLFFCSQDADVMTAYTLSDSPIPRWRLALWLLYLGCLQWSYFATRPSFIYIAFYSVLANLMLLFRTRNNIVAILEHNNKPFADYMKQESTSRSPFFDDSTTANSLYYCCKYPFMQKDGHWVNIKDLLQWKESQENPVDPSAKKKKDDVDADICLSYSFFQLLTRRYFGFHCAEERQPSVVRDFVLRELLPDQGYNRAFKVVQVQLALLHDYFFTGYHQTITRMSFPVTVSVKDKIKCVFSILIRIPALVIVWRRLSYHLLSDQYIMVGVPKSLFSVAPMILIFGSLHLLLKVPIFPKYWCTIMAAFQNYPTGEAIGRSSRASSSIKRFLRHHQGPIWLPLPQPYWQAKMGQYSLMEDYDRFWAKKFWKVCNALFKEYILSEASPSFLKHHPVEEKDVGVTDKVKRLVALTLQGINGPPTNGTRSLHMNGDQVARDLVWTCRKHTHTHTILIWHIANYYCGMSWPHQTDSQDLDFFEFEERKTYYEVATALSRYCAYLVAFLPEFLPEQRTATKVVLQEVLEEAQTTMSTEESDTMLIKQAWHKAKHVLGLGRMDLAAKRTRMENQHQQLPGDVSRLTTFEKGIRLGVQLEELNTCLRWKLMAEFWAETILYVAPSDNVAVHVEQLTKGGQFVTHLWALLSNAGLLKRATDEWRSSQQQQQQQKQPS